MTKSKKSENQNGGWMKNKSAILEKVAEIYRLLDKQTAHYADPVKGCRACGQCCDFEKFDHRLYITTPELIYFIENVGRDNLKSMTASRCPYNVDGKCAVYKYRFGGCRLFCCKSSTLFQGQLSEKVLKEFKSLCNTSGLDYKYMELSFALNSFAPQYLSMGSGTRSNG